MILRTVTQLTMKPHPGAVDVYTDGVVITMRDGTVMRYTRFTVERAERVARELGLATVTEWGRPEPAASVVGDGRRAS